MAKADGDAPVVNGLQRVQVFSIARPPRDTPKDKRRYRVKWRIDGRDKTRAFKTRAQADRLRARLLVAASDGEPFDVATGLPASWLDAPPAPTWWAWSQEWLVLKWPQWSGHSRRSVVESLVAIIPLMARPGAPAPGHELVDWLRQCGYRPGPAGQGEVPAWLRTWSVPLPDIDVQLLERVLHRVTTKAEATPCPPRWRGAGATRSGPCCDRRSDEACSTATRWSASSGGQDLRLPRHGWGMAALRGAVTSLGVRYTAEGTVVEAEGLKQRPIDSVRDVPLAPVLVDRLRWHLARWQPVDGRVFSNAAGRPMTSTNYGPVWVRARSQLWPLGHPLAATTVYDLRHPAATMMLRAAVPAAEVARRLGHSVDVLLGVYARVFEDERERSNELIEHALTRLGWVAGSELVEEEPGEDVGPKRML